VDESSPARATKKKRAAASRAGAASPEPFAIVEVPADPAIFEHALLLLQPLWVRVGGHVVIWTVLFCFVGAVQSRWPDMLRIELKIVVAVPAAILSFMYWGLRRGALRREVDRWFQRAAREEGDRIEINDDGLVYHGASIPWSDVSDAAELDGAGTMLLALRARGAWIILPAQYFTRGDFRGTQSLLLRKIGDKLRIIQQ
jgi:hypothetical protein